MNDRAWPYALWWGFVGAVMFLAKWWLDTHG